MASVRTLYRLQTVDQALILARGRLGEIEERLKGDEDLQALQRVVSSLIDQVSQSRARLRDSELDNQSLSEKMAAVQERLYGGRVTNPRELSSLQDEVGYLTRRQKQLEDRILDVMVRLDEQGEELRDQQEQLAQASARWEALQVSLRAEQTELEAQVKQLGAQRSAVRGTLQPGELSIYDDLLRRKRGVAVALLQGQVCGGCGMRLPTRVVQQARQVEALQFCSSCGRILSLR
jgi:predicted  nucleic acid-binding Zn-ribbon protein